MKNNNRIKNLIKNTLIISLGTFLPQLTSLITLPILTSKLTSEAYGYYDLIGTLISLLLPIVTMQIQAAGFRFIINVRDDKSKCTNYITNIFFIISISSILCSVIIAIIFRKVNFLLLLAIILYFIVDVFFNATIQIVRGFSKNKIFAIGAIVQSIVKMIVLCALLIPVNLGLLGSVIALLIGTVISFIYEFFTVKMWKYIDIKNISPKTIKELLSYSWPMVPNTLSGWILKASDRLVITWTLGIEKNAIYAIANKIPNLLGILNNAFTMAWQENASLSSKDEDIELYYTNMYNSFISFIGGGCALLISCTPILFLILIKGNYSEAYNQMPILFLGVFYSCISSFLGGIYIANKKTKNVGLTTIIAAVINLLLDLLLVNLIGISAGSISTLVSYIVIVYYRMYDLRKFQNINYNYKKLCIINLLLIIMSILCYINVFYLNLINIVIGIIFAYKLNEKFLIFIIKKGADKIGNKKKSKRNKAKNIDNCKK